MSLVVLKFGGTSLANTKLMNDAVAKVIHEISSGNHVIVVVSAMAGVTDHLVGLTHEIIDCENLDNLTEYASIITTGEQVSAGLFALLLQQNKIKARSWLGWQVGIITDDNVDNSNIIELKCNEVEESFKLGYQVAVVTGFQGITKSNRISTLGRGGSDTSAIILAGALKADRCDIYTDVDGVFTADPRIVAKAKKLDHINYDEMIEFAYAGAKVLQAKSVEWAKHYNVKLQVLSSFTSNSGTVVSNENEPYFIAGIALIRDEKDLNIAKISIIGMNINQDALFLLKQTLADNSIEILSQEIREISVMIKVKDEEKFDAVRVLHTAFGLDES